MNSLIRPLPSAEPRLFPLGELERERDRRLALAQQIQYGGTIDESRERCRSLAQFAREAWHFLEPKQALVWGWALDLICAHLEAVSRGEITRLLINVPPGMMKSLLVSVLWPAWEWGPWGRPDLRYLSTSYADSLSVRDSRKMRDLVMSEWFQARWPIVLTRDAEDDFANSEKGGRECRAFRNLTGGRGDRVIVDDPHSTEGAESEADRLKAIRVFRESLHSRVNNEQSAIVIIMQRLHQQDVSGMVQELGLPYVHVMLPMEFEPDRRCVTKWGEDPREVADELLFPERFTPEGVIKLKAPLGSYGIAGQLQQRPSVRGGVLFKRHEFKIIETIPRGCRFVRGWDLAASDQKDSAFTAGVLLAWSARDRMYIVCDAQHKRVTIPDSFIQQLAEQDRLMYGDVEISIPQDPGSAGKIQAKSIVAGLSGFVVHRSPESGDKWTRAQAVAAQAEAGNMGYVPGAWNDPFFQELEIFPTGAFKDFADALSRAFGRFALSAQSLGSPIAAFAPREYPGG